MDKTPWGLLLYKSRPSHPQRGELFDTLLIFGQQNWPSPKCNPRAKVSTKLHFRPSNFGMQLAFKRRNAKWGSKNETFCPLRGDIGRSLDSIKALWLYSCYSICNLHWRRQNLERMKMPFCSFEANFALVPIEIKPSLAGGWLFEFRGPYESTIPIVCSMVTSRYACQNSYRSKGPSGTVFCPSDPVHVRFETSFTNV